jgi:hypothetical protein
LGFIPSLIKSSEEAEPVFEPEDESESTADTRKMPDVSRLSQLQGQNGVVCVEDAGDSGRVATAVMDWRCAWEMWSGMPMRHRTDRISSTTEYAEDTETGVWIFLPCIRCLRPSPAEEVPALCGSKGEEGVPSLPLSWRTSTPHPLMPDTFPRTAAHSGGVVPGVLTDWLIWLRRNAVDGSKTHYAHERRSNEREKRAGGHSVKYLHTDPISP